MDIEVAEIQQRVQSLEERLSLLGRHL